MSSQDGEPRTFAEGSDMTVCGACGARVLAHQTVCAACGRDTQLGVKTVSPLPAELFWVQVRAQFQCQRCRHSSPLNHPDVDGAFDCVRCQLEQPASPEVWKEGLLFAHAVAEIGSPGAELRQPPIDMSRSYNFHLEGLGTSRSSASLHTRMTIESATHFERHSLEMEASPGQPLCELCSEPLHVQADADGVLCTTCSGCGDRATFKLDERARRLHPGVVGACANELRSDRAVVQLGPLNSREAVSVQCPQCGAALELTARDHFVKCGYCQTPSNVPAKLKRQLFPSSVLVERWWLLFKGVAPERFLVSEGLREEAEEEREEEEQRQRERAERVRVEKAEARKQRAEARRLHVVLGSIGALCMTVMVVALIFMPKEKDKPAPGVRAQPATRPSPATKPVAVTAAVASPPPPAILLKDCYCMVKPSGASVPQRAVLSVRSIPQVSGSAHDYALAFAINVEGRELGLMTSAYSAPPATLRGATLQLALGCTGDTVAIASGSVASGWSASTGGLQWSSDLPARYREEGSAGSALNVLCQRVPVIGDVMPVQKSLKVRVSDGKLL